MEYRARFLNRLPGTRFPGRRPRNPKHTYDRPRGADIEYPEDSGATETLEVPDEEEIRRRLEKIWDPERSYRKALRNVRQYEDRFAFEDSEEDEEEDLREARRPHEYPEVAPDIKVNEWITGRNGSDRDRSEHGGGPSGPPQDQLVRQDSWDPPKVQSHYGSDYSWDQMDRRDQRDLLRNGIDRGAPSGPSNVRIRDYRGVLGVDDDKSDEDPWDEEDLEEFHNGYQDQFERQAKGEDQWDSPRDQSRHGSDHRGGPSEQLQGQDRRGPVDHSEHRGSRRGSQEDHRDSSRDQNRRGGPSGSPQGQDRRGSHEAQGYGISERDQRDPARDQSHHWSDHSRRGGPLGPPQNQDRRGSRDLLEHQGSRRGSQEDHREPSRDQSRRGGPSGPPQGQDRRGSQEDRGYGRGERDQRDLPRDQSHHGSDQSRRGGPTGPPQDHESQDQSEHRGSRRGSQEVQEYGRDHRDAPGDQNHHGSNYGGQDRHQNRRGSQDREGPQGYGRDQRPPRSHNGSDNNDRRPRNRDQRPSNNNYRNPSPRNRSWSSQGSRNNNRGYGSRIPDHRHQGPGDQWTQYRRPGSRSSSISSHDGRRRSKGDHRQRNDKNRLSAREIKDELLSFRDVYDHLKELFFRSDMSVNGCYERILHMFANLDMEPSEACLREECPQNDMVDELIGQLERFSSRDRREMHDMRKRVVSGLRLELRKKPLPKEFVLWTHKVMLRGRHLWTF